MEDITAQVPLMQVGQIYALSSSLKNFGFMLCKGSVFLSFIMQNTSKVLHRLSYKDKSS